MKIKDINGYTVLLNKFDIRYVEEVDAECGHDFSAGIIVVFKDDTDLRFDIFKKDLSILENLFN